jgi:glycine/D-amino acid oxidase-like deaminating enzyme
MQQIDYLIVGQGVAGTLLAHFLQSQACRVHVIDEYSEHAASQVAAGIINPITGRRYVKSWRVDELIPFALQTYRELEAKLGIQIFHERNIIRTLFNSREENDWLARTAQPGYEDYMLDQAVLDEYATHTLLAYSYGEVTQSGQTDLRKLTHAFREQLKQQGALTESAMVYDDLKVEADQVVYGDLQARRLVFCEGAQGASNPFFSYLPFGGAKGEVLLVRIPDVDFEKILKHRVFIVPLAEKDHYWIGSTYGWKYDDARPTEKGRSYLEERLRDVLQTPFEVLHHRSAIRPTVKDRRPFLGQHPEMKPLYLFNGLGTKGASLGPFWARHMVDFLEKGQALDTQVDITRFES